MIKTKIKTHGGVRIPGPGKTLGTPPKLKGAAVCKDYLDEETIQQAAMIGNGNRSAGIRRSVQTIARLLKSGAITIDQVKEAADDKSD